MGSKRASLLQYLCILILIYSFGFSAVAANDDHNKLQNYIVFVRPATDVNTSVLENTEKWHNSLLSTVLKDSSASRLIYSYNTVVNGFAAKLTEEEVQELLKHPWCVRAILANNRYKLTTTQTPKFLNLRGRGGLWRRTKNMGEGMIIGIIDSGIWPDHPSFSGKGMPKPPAKWKGHCDFKTKFCNNKLIGAKSFLRAGAEEQKHIPPFDTGSHGTHTASTAAGAFVKNISVFGNAMGLASGMAPRAHIAVYRVCRNEISCEQPDILRAIEEAVRDGCDVLSISLGGYSTPFYDDPISIGGFTASLKGVFVSTAAGNEGPLPFTLSNDAPWLLTVAASTINRRFVSTVKLGNGLQLDGESVYQPDINIWMPKMFPLVYLGKARDIKSGQCLKLDRKQVNGKIVICDRGGSDRIQKGLQVSDAGGVGMILVNYKEDGYDTIQDKYEVLPASNINYFDGEKLKKYIRSTNNPVATLIFKGVVMDNIRSPSIANFSSRGPSKQNSFILKPDITGPGVNILAGVPPVKAKEKTYYFDLMSGTSMACPHLSGIAALIKKAHPTWSPAAIKSAIMTTAYWQSLDRKPMTNGNHLQANAYDMGAGHVDPSKALNPGLVYDIHIKEYVPYLCGLGYSDDKIRVITHPLPPVKCAKTKAIPQEQLNYPSMVVPLSTGNAVIYRTVTNVGHEKDSYKAKINVPRGVSATVIPETLNFTRVYEKKTFKIVFKWVGGNKVNSFGDLNWISKRHVVRSPIVLHLAAETLA
ncbi:Subtilisin-like serine protease [Rhynchospora pubera]|uniref:Subtilisin-like serine protease n=1 Tax=Rhynchospora pubera TaxID=906938 RepID=A0AAV8G3A1_9POAL|nr:Subtilisin-like serine protease [Rhynchospora pubera]